MDIKGLRFTHIGIRLKGGPGSGHHGHAGIPGQVGGSAPSSRIAVIRGLEKTLVGKDSEEAYLVSPSGSIVAHFRGDINTVDTQELPNQKGLILTHNHPVEYGMSMDDIMGSNGLKRLETRAVLPSGRIDSLKHNGKYVSEKRLWHTYKDIEKQVYEDIRTRKLPKPEGLDYSGHINTRLAEQLGWTFVQELL